MKRLSYILILTSILLFTSILLADTRIVEFYARREDNKAILHWVTEQEENLQKFLIQRSTDVTNWTTLGEEKPVSESSTTRREYEFTDKSIYKNENTTFYYRLVIVDNSGRSTPYSVIVSIPGSSGIRQTWGSIKAMFR
jgi:hypothetical protein